MPDPQVSEYAADQVSMSLAGYDIARGLVEGSFVKVARISDTFTEKVGSDGEVALSMSLDRRAEATLKLMQSSTANTILSALLSLAEQRAPAIPGVSPGKGPWEFILTDRSSGAEFHADKAWIVKPADADYANQSGEREWKIRIAHLKSMPVAGALQNFGNPPSWLQTALPSVASALSRALGVG